MIYLKDVRTSKQKSVCIHAHAIQNKSLRFKKFKLSNFRIQQAMLTWFCVQRKYKNSKYYVVFIYFIQFLAYLYVSFFYFGIFFPINDLIILFKNFLRSNVQLYLSEEEQLQFIKHFLRSLAYRTSFRCILYSMEDITSVQC